MKKLIRAVVVAQLAARLLPIPEDPGSHRQLLLNNYLPLTVCRKDEIKWKKRPGMAHLKKEYFWNKPKIS